MTANPNWPTLFAEAEFGVNPFYTSAASLIYTDLTPRLYQSWSLHRGRQFELDQMQPGQWTGQWRNRDGFLDPTNTGSPYAPGVVPFRGYRLRAQWPSSVNLVTGDVATGGEVTPLAVNASVSNLTSGYATPVVTASSSAWQGTQVWQVTLGASATTGLSLIQVANLPIQATAGTPYTMTWHVRSSIVGANPVVTPVITWVNWSGTVSTTTGSAVSLTGASNAAWTQVVLSSTVPAGAVAVSFGFLLTTAPGIAWGFQADGIQFEQNSTASVFSASGKNYPLYSGLIERYPQSWASQGSYGLVLPIGVDVLAPLSQNLLKEAFIMDVAATSPTWFYPLNDASGSTTFAEQAGRYPAAGLFSSANGAGTVTVGNSITATTAAGKFIGTNGPVVSINNPNQNQGTVIDLTPAGITSAPSTGAWTRMIAFRTAMTSGVPCFAAYTDGNNTVNRPSLTSYMSWGTYNPSGTNLAVQALFYNAAGQILHADHPSIINDGNWHLSFIQMDATGQNISVWVDGVTASASGPNDMHPTLAINESIGGEESKLASSVGYGANNYVGDVALYAQWNRSMLSTEMQNLYTSWRSAWQGESTDARYSRILKWAGYIGPSNIGAGSTTSIGPATDVAGADALTALNNLVDTEAGRHYVAADGTVTFQSRKTQFVNTTPMWTFGENNGEIPYSNITFDYDPTHLSNQVTVTQNTTNQVFYAFDANSAAAYGPRALTRSSQATNTEEVRQSAYYWLAKYSQPALRIAAIRINAGANPSLFPSVLAFEIGQRVRINRRDQAGLRPTITTDGFIEQVTHTADNAGAWVTDLEISPAPTTAYGVFTTLQTTLSTGSSSGAFSITINALPDAATNPAAANLTGGQQLTVGAGASLEVVTIAPGGVQATSPGYTTATITLTTALSHSHSSGDAVQADANPQYYNASVFGSTQFAF